MKAAKPNPLGAPGVNGPSPTTGIIFDRRRRARIDLEITDESIDRTRRFFFEWAIGARVRAEREIIYLVDDVDGRLPAGSTGTVTRRALTGRYSVRWDLMPGHELATSADALLSERPSNGEQAQ